MLAILLWEWPPSQWDLGFLFDFLQLFQGGAQGDFPPWDRMMASRHMRGGLSFREQGILFDSWGRTARLIAVGGWQSHRAGGWQGRLEPRAPLHPAPLRCNVPWPGGSHHHLPVLQDCQDHNVHNVHLISFLPFSSGSFPERYPEHPCSEMSSRPKALCACVEGSRFFSPP